ncbi:MAG: copper resistance protein NlpE [Deltaproteobacteria bacterium]|nr:copper resistance protein NlpE [Deltaproteobacteria bacterium]
MRRWPGLVVLLLLAAACTRRSTPPAAPPPPPPTPALRAHALPLVGRFAGTLPCADCSGVETELTLASDWDGRSLYHLKETYVGAPGGPRSVETDGVWISLRGTAVDPTAKVYRLDPESAAPRSFVVIDERTIRLLDADLQPLPSSVPSTLTRAD